MIGDEGRAHTLAFECGVGGDGGAVDDGQRSAIQAERLDTGEDRLFRRLRRGELFVNAQLSTVVIDKVGKGAAGVDAENFNIVTWTRLCAFLYHLADYT